jgi:hypothetical protein
LRKVWTTAADGERIRIERPKQVRLWSWLNAAGCFFSVYYGGTLLKLDGDMTAISLVDRSELPNAIKAVIEAVRAGELDLSIDELAEKSIPDIRLGSLARSSGN